MEHKTVSLADQIFEQLEYEILCGKYVRGEVLTEARLSEELGVSRTPIREALRRLEQEHLLSSTSKGALVVGISKEDIAMIYELRLRIEGIAVRLAAEHAREADLAELKDALDLQEFYVGKGDADNIRDMDSRFHNKLYAMSGSAPLCDTLKELHKKVLKYRRASVRDLMRAAESVREHEAILAAVAAHDTARAEELTVEHIRNARDHILEKTLPKEN